MGNKGVSERIIHARMGWVAAALVVATLALRFWPSLTVLDRIELRTLDWRFANRGTRPPDPDIAIVDVDEESIAKLGRWPWPRRRFAEVIRRLDEAGARAIILDIFFADPDTGPGGAASDDELIAATREAGMVYHAAFGHPPQAGGAPRQGALREAAWSDTRVVPGRGLNAVAELLELGELIVPVPGLAQAAADVGFVNVVDSGDGIYRHTVPVVTHDGELYPSLSLAAAAGLLGFEPGDVSVHLGRHVALGERRIPIDRMGRMLIDFAGGAGTYPYVPVHEVLGASGEDGARARFEDRIVFLAVSAPGLYDLRASPFDTVYNGVETQANALENILGGRFLRQAPGEVCVVTVLAIAVVMLLLLSRLPPRWAIGFAAAMLVGYNRACVEAFTHAGLVLDVAAPNLVLVGCVFAGLALRLVGQESEQQRVRTALSRFVPEGVMEQLVQQEPEELLRGRRRVVTVMFMDLRDFTEQSQHMPPEQTVELLNRFFAFAQETIWEFDGTLDKYMGDGLMAFWNSPLDQPDHALLGVRTAVHMLRRIRYNAGEWEFLGMPELAAGIGIATGEALVGYVGTGERMQYTVIGPQVNLAARLEALTRDLDCDILISGETHELVAHAVQARSAGPVEVRGVAEPVDVWEVIELRDE